MKGKEKRMGIDYKDNAKEYPNQKSAVFFELWDLNEKICPGKFGITRTRRVSGPGFGINRNDSSSIPR